MTSSMSALSQKMNRKREKKDRKKRKKGKILTSVIQVTVGQRQEECKFMAKSRAHDILRLSQTT